MLSTCHSQFLQPVLQGSEFFQQKKTRVAIENPHRDKDQGYLHSKLNELLIDFHIDNLPHTIRGPQR